jgi:hypothetical protein
MVRVHEIFDYILASHFPFSFYRLRLHPSLNTEFIISPIDKRIHILPMANVEWKHNNALVHLV